MEKTVKIPEGMAINLITSGRDWQKWYRACAWIDANPIAKAMRQKVRYHFAKRIQQRKAGVLPLRTPGVHRAKFDLE